MVRTQSHYLSLTHLNKTQRVDGYVALPAFSEETPPARPTSKNLARGFFVSSTEGGQTYSYAYGPAGVPGLRGNHYTLASAALASIGGLLFGYDQGVIANVLVMKDFRLRWALTDWQEGVVSELKSCTRWLWF